MKRRDFVSMFAGVLAFRPPALPPFRLVERWSWAMGQPVHLMLFHESEDAGLEAAARVLEELRRVEARLSRFDDASDLSELNRQAGKGSMRADLDLLAVLRAAIQARHETGGAFDPAVEPLMRLWGFREPRKAAPGAREIAAARAAVRASVIRIEDDRITLPSAVTQLDLGGIGVGFGLDRAAGVLRAHGIARAFLDVSGDCIALGAPPGQAGWRVDLTVPGRPGVTRSAGLLRERALATSANTVSVVRCGAVLRGHVMDPASGFPADGLLQTTVLARTGLAADALSTAMLVAGRPFEGVERFWVTAP
jgi:thiamine biosynthesis lipoprotein